MSWPKAAVYYERLVTKGKGDAKTYERLGNCYRNLSDWEQAEYWYKRLYISDSSNSKSMLSYAMALRANGNYTLAKYYYLKYSKVSPTDSRGVKYREEINWLEKLNKQEPFFAIREIAQNTSYAEFGPTYDQGKLVFSSSRDPYVSIVNKHSWNDQPFLDLFTSSINSDGDISQIRRLDSKINTRYHEGPACFTPDGNTMFFTRNNYRKRNVYKDPNGTSLLSIFRAKKNGSNWVEEYLPFNSEGYSCGHPAISADGKWLYFSSDMSGGLGGSDIYKAQLSDDGTIGKPINLGNQINTEGNEFFPFMDNKGYLFFASDGWPGLGGLDMFVGFPSVIAGFSKVINLGQPLNSHWDDFSLVLDTSGRQGYYSSNREGGAGSDDIYSVKMIKDFRASLGVTGIAYDKTTSKPIGSTKIVLKNDDGVTVGTVTTDSSGRYRFDLKPTTLYILSAEKEKYFPVATNFISGGKNFDSTVVYRNLYLDQDAGASILVTVIDRKTKEKISGVKLGIMDNLLGKTDTTKSTDEVGSYRLPLEKKRVGDRLSFNFDFKKTGYISKPLTYNAGIEKLGEIPVVLEMDRLEIGKDISEFLGLNPIYFDLGKWAIRPDAAKELDKVVAAMQKNPTMVIELGSHTDCRGNMQSNMDLSDKRAKSSAAYIVSKGIDASRITGKGYGESKLMNDCACEGAVKSKCSETEHQLNRRTEFILVSF
jgi:outer membrane protein OmpA-like peptidoglycan-associated protein